MTDEAQLERWRASIRWNTERYLRCFRRIAEAGGWAPHWNMAAFLHSTGWFWYRRMFGWAVLNLVAPFALLFAFAFVFGASTLAPGGNLDRPVLILAIAYLLMVFLVVPIYADSIYYRQLRARFASAQPAPRPPSVWTVLGAVALGLVWFALVLAMLLPAYGDYTPRAKVSEAILAASSIRTEVTAFYDENRRLPTPQEASRFRSDRPSRWVETIEYDAAERRIAVTLREIFPGKRFALHAHDSGGQVTWTCRTIDLEKKHLPASCRH